MPRFFFHSTLDGERVIDPEGLVYLSQAEAVADAHEAARALLAEQVRAGKAQAELELEVVSSEGVRLETVQLSVVVWTKRSQARDGRID